MDDGILVVGFVIEDVGCDVLWFFGLWLYER